MQALLLVAVSIVRFQLKVFYFIDLFLMNLVRDLHTNLYLPV